MRLLNRYKQVLLFVLLILVWGCSAHKNDKIPKSIRKLKNLTVIPADAKPANQIDFKKDGIYGNSKNVLIGRIGGIDVDDSGRVFIADYQKVTIDIFEPDGTYFTHIGRKGRGPGEFGYIVKPYIINNRLYVYDPVGLRINIFSIDSLKLVTTLNLNPTNLNKISGLRGYNVSTLYPVNSGNYIVSFNTIVLTNPHLPNYNGNRLYRKFYLMNDRGKIISHPFYYPYNKLTLTLKSALKSQDYIKSLSAEKYRQSILKQNKNNFPKTFPALNNLKIDDQNRLWVSTIVRNMKVYQWWVLSSNGKLIARFTWPRSKPIEVIKNGNIYTKETDTTTGMSKIVRYRIEMKPFG